MLGRTAKVVSFSLPPKLLKEIEAQAEKESRTKSELLREALRRYLKTQSEENIARLREREKIGERIAKKLGWTSEDKVEKEVAKIIAEERYGKKA